MKKEDIRKIYEPKNIIFQNVKKEIGVVPVSVLRKDLEELILSWKRDITNARNSKDLPRNIIGIHVACSMAYISELESMFHPVLEDKE